MTKQEFYSLLHQNSLSLLNAQRDELKKSLSSAKTTLEQATEISIHTSMLYSQSLIESLEEAGIIHFD